MIKITLLSVGNNSSPPSRGHTPTRARPGHSGLGQPGVSTTDREQRETTVETGRHGAHPAHGDRETRGTPCTWRQGQENLSVPLINEHGPPTP